MLAAGLARHAAPRVGSAVIAAWLALRAAGTIAAGTILVLSGSAPSLGAQGTPAPISCPQARADSIAEAGWTAWRANDVATAADRFALARTLCPTRPSAWTGLGYVALRRDAVPEAAAAFERSLGLDTTFDAAVGLGLARFRLGTHGPARDAFELAERLNPGDAMVSEYLRRIPVPVDPARLPPRVRPDTLVLGARVAPRRLEVPDGRGGWRPFWVKAVNLGAALPGRHPAEFPPDDGTYEGWIADLAELGANTVRVYTVHPPHFYRALRAWNLAHPERPLWIIHGIWTELPPGQQEERYDDPTWNARFLAEMRDVVDLLHGRAAIAPRPGHASGMYTADVSAWTLGFIIGREWEPYSVVAFAAMHPNRTRFEGRYVRLEGGNAVDVWLAGIADSLVAYETAQWNAQRPVAYTNWPTLDPLHHPTETSRAEEAAWLARRGERVPEASREYDNDVIGLDATKMHAKPAFAAGLFASYHAYPYYPDFMVLDSAYGATVGPEGPSHYLGYLKALVAHHGDIPVVISEYGVPSSRGNAHLQPQGWHHGGHDEQAQATINARLTREIAASGAAGVGLFALIDEWFKKNWLVIDFEQPAERNRLWLNPLDAEQNYGLIAMRPGLRDSAIVIDGRGDDWNGRQPLYRRAADAPARDPAQRLDALWVHHDEAYVYLRLDVGAVDWTAARYVIGIDTYDPRRGDSRLPFTGSRVPTRLEFALDLAGPGAGRLLVDRPYNLYRFEPIVGARPPATQSVYNRPFRTMPNDDARYDTVWVTPNRRTIGRDGRVFDAQRLERNLLRHARQAESTLADWYADAETGIIELRIPWGLLHVLDPSSHHVLFGTQGRDPTGVATDGFRFVVESHDPAAPEDASRRDLLPRDGATFATPRTWQWPAWEMPRWYAERKPQFGAMQAAFAAIPDTGPAAP